MIISLLYHDVVPSGNFAGSGFPGADADIYKLTRPEFERHLEAIAQRAASSEVSLLNSRQKKLADQTLLLTFDDGGVSAMLIADLLEAQGWRGHFFIPTDYIGRNGFLTISQIRELHRRGHVIGSHSCSHPARISRCRPAQLDQEWRQSAQILADGLGERVGVGSVPGGFYARRVAAAAQQAGIEVLFTSEPRSRLRLVDDCLIVGRYAIWQGTSAHLAASLARGDAAPRLRQFLFWTTKKLLKRMGGESYLALRKKLLEHRPSA
ncbi:MAG TPA: polysaccharide deacetylase family protein [Terriglobales bacterium]|nr:polysaccharide deacetylase family protein [Terriglobales bacterium]